MECQNTQPSILGFAGRLFVSVLFSGCGIAMQMDLKRVEQFAGMLGSEHDGERANAARFLHKMALESNLSMVEFFRQAFGSSGGERIVYRDRIVEKTVYRDREPERTSPSPKREAHQKASKAYGYGSMQGKLAAVTSHHWDKLTEFEKTFITSIKDKVNKGLDFTPKQRNVLSQIFEKLGM